MSKLTVSRKKNLLEEDYGILYIVFFLLEGKELVKIGVTKRNIEDRVSEILVSIFKSYREFPYCRPKRFRKTSNIYEKEAELHKLFADKKYEPKNRFSGSTEFFEVPLDEVVKEYEKRLDKCLD